jgi:TetR/AcrR family fatty acid metabolism transcriptional regulator
MPRIPRHPGASRPAEHNGKQHSTQPTSDTFRGTSKRERILRAAIDVFAQSGYFNAKVSDIAKAAGVADGTIYLYFDGKEDLLVTIFREHTSSYIQSLRRELVNIRRPEDRLRNTIRHHLETLGNDRALAVVAQVELRHSLKFMSAFSQQEVADYLTLIREIVEQGQSEGVFRRTLHPMLVAKAVFGILDEMVTSWILSEKEYSLGDQAEQVSMLVLEGLL